MNRFDFEQIIMKSWQTADDIDLLFRRVCEYNLEGDELQNALLGLATLHTLKSQELFEAFESLVRQGDLR